MKPTRLLIAAILSAAAVAACGRGDAPPAASDPSAPSATASADSAAVELPVRPQAVEVGAAIDWEAARRDLAARPIEEREASFQISSGEGAPPVPVFLPQAAAVVAGGELEMRFQPTPDGYFASFPGETYDVIVNGTNVVISETGAIAAPRGEDFRYVATATGGQVAFSRYGADYLVEFECKAPVTATATCITEEEAIAYARGLALSGTR